MEPQRLGPPPLNPFSRVLAGLFGLVALVGAFFFGFLILAVAVGVGLVAWGLIWLRLWWLRRRLRSAGVTEGPSGPRPDTRGDGKVIEGDYEVVSRRDD